jgi:phenylpropionate dioxygenase-like ring-hydroxylating dioxygenase large terminal subunit
MALGSHVVSWVDLGPVDAVPPGRTSAATVGDLDLVLWRTFDGELCVMEARCPHQWSHLAAEGVVDGPEIVCGAHFWRFTTEGVGTKLAMNGRRDPKADIRVFPSREREGRIEVDLASAP